MLPTRMQGLTERQQQILAFIHAKIQEKGYPPTIREIGEHMGIRSTNGVNDHLKALERKGFLKREGLKSRALRPVALGSDSALAELQHGGGGVVPLSSRPDFARQDLVRSGDFEGSAFGPETDAAPRSAAASVRGVSNVLPALIPHGDVLEIPVLGRVAAGSPILADEVPEATVRVDAFFLGRAAHKPVFALRVTGESMIDAGIFDGDYIFVKKQIEAQPHDIVVAMIDGEATVKRYEPDKNVIRFVAENASMPPIVVRREDFRQTSILGVVCGVFRRV